MKAAFLVLFISISTGLSAQKTQKNIYIGKIGISTVEFTPGNALEGSTAKIITGNSTATYNYCSEEENPKVQKLCLYDSKKGYDYKKNIKIKLPFGAKIAPKAISGTYYVNGQPVNFRLVKNS
jgi:hypothetical protein